MLGERYKLLSFHCGVFSSTHSATMFVYIDINSFVNSQVEILLITYRPRSSVAFPGIHSTYMIHLLIICGFFAVYHYICKNVNRYWKYSPFLMPLRLSYWKILFRRFVSFDYNCYQSMRCNEENDTFSLVVQE